jgi:hypothetical protein
MDEYDYAKSKEPSDLIRCFHEFVKRDDDEKWKSALNRISRLESALKRIADMKRCPTVTDWKFSETLYRDGHADGHRCAAEIAREALK